MAFDISKFAATLNVSESDTRMQEIPLDRIVPNSRNFYPKIDEAAMDDLVDSIRANGLLEPLTVVPDDKAGWYRLISGHNRFAALLSLKKTTIYRADAPHKWDTVMCLVLPSMTEQQEISAIIEANRQRRKSGALLAEEAEKLTKSYACRKAAGEELPGRIRERVAEALQVSQTKLATVQAIKNNLAVPGFKARWENDDIPEDAAYEISKLPHEQQYRYLDWTIDNHQPVTARTVKAFVREAANPPKPALVPATPTPAPAPVKPMDRSPALADPRLDWRTIGPKFGERLTELRKATGKSRKEFAEYIDKYPNTYSAWENGDLPGSCYIPMLALALHVSTDYLLGLTDERYSSNIQMTDPRYLWRPLDADHWPAYNSLVLLRGETSLQGRVYQAAHCIGLADDRFPMEDANDHFDLDREDLQWFTEWTPLEGGDGCAET